MKAGRGIYDRDDVSFTIARPARSKNDIRKPESGIVLTSAATYMGQIKARSFSLLAREFDGFHSLSLRVESKVS